MNKLKTIIILFSITFFCSCSKFLEEVSQDEIIPKTVKEYSEFLYGEGYIRDAKVVHPYLDIMTDDSKSFYGKVMLIANDTRDFGFGYYTWQEQPEYTMGGPINNDKTWQTYYKCILVSNMVLDNIEKMEGLDTDKSTLKAEAHLIRAYSYFMLVNLYANPYDKSTASKSPGVPINNLIYMQDVRLPRENLQANYDLIMKDIDDGITAFGNGNDKKNIFRWNLTAAQLLASRVYLYMKDYEKSAYYSSLVLLTNPSLYDLNTKSTDAIAAAKVFLNNSNPEILFSFGDYYISYFIPSANGCFPTSESLKSSFSADDLRFNKSTGAFIREQGNFFGKQYSTFKGGSKSSSMVYGFALRSAEAYLNRAEAYAEQNKIDLAMTDINRLRKTRIKISSYTELKATSKEAAIEIIRKERRLELCYEQHRWFDLRRWNQPEITHEFVNEFNPYTISTYVLNAKDAAYILPIPIAVINYQPDMPNNSRPKREKNN